MTTLKKSEGYYAFKECDQHDISWFENLWYSENEIKETLQVLTKAEGQCGIVFLGGVLPVQSDEIAAAMLHCTPGVFAIQKPYNSGFSEHADLGTLCIYKDVEIPVDVFFQNRVHTSLDELLENQKQDNLTLFVQNCGQLLKEIGTFYSECPEVMPPVVGEVAKLLKKVDTSWDLTKMKSYVTDIENLRSRIESAIESFFPDGLDVNFVSDRSQLIRIELS